MKRQMIVAGLRARPVRSIVTILAVAFEVILILLIIGLTTGIMQDGARRTAGVGGELMIQPANASIITAVAENSMALGVGDRIRELPGVKAVAPVMIKMNIEGSVEIVYGIDSHFTEVSGGFNWIKGGIFKAPDEMVVDDLWAADHHAEPGDVVTMLNNKFKVAGIVQNGQGSRIFMSMEALSKLLDQTPKAGLFYVKLADPAQLQTVQAEIRQLLGDPYKVTNFKDFMSQMVPSNIPGLNYFINAVVAIALTIGVLVIFLSMYTTITERTREIGILRALGASKAFIVGLIFLETAVVCIIGVAVGTVASKVIQRVLHASNPTLMIEITRGWIVAAAVFAILSGIIGSFYPSLKAAKQDPVEALAYE